MYHIRVDGVLIICDSKESVAGWLDYCIKRGSIPSVEEVLNDH